MSNINTRLAAALAGRYTIDRELGHGGMATVHLARDVKHGRVVAIKVLRPELAQAIGSERFLREINIAAQLQSPHILPLLDSGEADGLVYYVMPFVEGASLRGRLATEGALAPSEAMRLLRDVVDGLAHAHRQGVIHRDIKPDNVMIAERHALLVDFGVAKALSDASAHHDLTSIGVSLGTPAYMAPEQAAADPNTDHRADIYSIGILAYELLSGKPPFTGAPQVVLISQITAAPEPLLKVKPDVPPAIAQIVMRCLEKDPAKRFQTADELLIAIESLVTPTGAYAGAMVPKGIRTRRNAMRVAGVAVLALIAIFATGRIRSTQWVHATALPELRRLAEAAEQDSAFALMLEIEDVAPDDSTLLALQPLFSRRALLSTEMDGVEIHRATMTDTSQWYRVGTTPMKDSVRLPARVGLFRYTKPGFRTVYRLAGSASTMTLLDAEDAPDAGMVRIRGGELRAFLVGADGNQPVQLGEYGMDRFEITNQQYRQFVDADGYAKREYWEHAIVDGARTLKWEEAMARFVDRTGRPGPAIWEGGGYPADQAKMPVGGVSWYEAAAYAKFAGRSLPTIFHWSEAASVRYARYMVPLSNLNASSPLPVGTPRAVSAMGVSDMGGNVREWVFNEAGRGQRFILGGGWSDPSYGLVDAYAQPPIDRSAINGIRLVRYKADEPNLASAQRALPRAFTDYVRAQPVSDAVFAGYRPQFDYDPIALDAKIELRDTTHAEWNLERVSFAAAYGGERMSAWIRTPKRSTGKLQPIVMFPGSGSINGGPSDKLGEVHASYVVRSGRAFVIPIYKSTHERTDSLRSDIPDQSIFYRDHVVMWVKDYRRTLDYLSTRGAEFDSTRFGYFGFSWGGMLGGLIPAVEPRVKATVLYVAGLTMERSRPEVDVFNFLPRVKSPVLMLNGRHDFFFPVETSQKPFYDRLGSGDAGKKYIVYEGGHDVPRTQLIQESLGWFDKWLGGVR